MGVGEGDHVLIDCSLQPILGPSKLVYIIPMKSMALREACAAPVDGSQPEEQSSHLHPGRRVGVVS